MPNKKEHQDAARIVGGMIACISNLASQTERQRITGQPAFNFAELLMSVAVGCAVGTVAGILPDTLEPAYHPGHRSVCHSVAAGLVVGIGIKKLNENPSIPRPLKTLGNTAGAAYISHLVMDSQTPKGLPILGKF